MSTVSSLYDGFLSIMETTFASPTYRKLVNPFVPDLNDSLSLNRGWGFYMGPKEVFKKMGRDEGFSFEIKVVQSIVHRGTERDSTIRESSEKTLLEDQFLIIDYFRANTAPIANVWDISFSSDNGFEYVEQEHKQFIIIQTTFKGIYSESC